MFKYLLSILLFFSALNAGAQTNKYFDDIKKTFDKDGQNKLNSVSKALKDAQKNYIDAQKLFSAEEISKALAKSKKASSVFKENYRTIYTLYNDKLVSITEESEGNQKIYYQNKLQDAKNYYRVAIYNRLKAGEEKKAKTVYDLLNAAHENELLATDVLSNIFAVINGWEETDYKTEEESDYNKNELFANTNTRSYKSRSFSVNDPSLENSFKFNHQVVSNNNNSSEINSDFYVNDNQTNTITRNSKEHEFRIQIGTSILPANEMQLKRLNKTDKPVSTYKSKIYYKYTVGSFSDFQEAKNFKNAYGLTNVYIVEYRNGKEVKFYMKDYQ